MRKTLLYAPLKGTMTGQRKVSEMVRDAVHFDYAFSITADRGGRWGNAAQFAVCVVAITWVMLRHRGGVFYFTCSRTEGGFIRDLVLVHLARLAGWVVINHVHGTDIAEFLSTGSQITRRLKYATYGRIDRHIVLGPSMAQSLGSFPFIRGIECVPNPVDARLISTIDRDRQPPPPLRVLFLSHVMASKGVFDAVEACVRYRTVAAAQNLPGIKLKIAGEFLGDEHLGARDCKRRLEALLDEDIAYVGPVDYVAKAALLMESHVFVLPTFYKSEGMPLALLEAMSSGCVCITTRSGCMTDFLSDQHVYFVVQHDPGAIAAVLVDIARFGSEVRNKLQASRRLSMDVFSYAAFAESMGRIIGGAAQCH